MSKTRKVMHVEVFDFDSDTMAYAKDSGKNQFGYKCYNEYLQGGEVIRKGPEYNHVEAMSFYNRTFNMNPDQLKSLKKKVNKMLTKAFCFVDEDNSVEVVVRGGSTITYNGNHVDDFMEKVLEIKRPKQ